MAQSINNNGNEIGKLLVHADNDIKNKYQAAGDFFFFT